MYSHCCWVSVGFCWCVRLHQPWMWMSPFHDSSMTVKSCLHLRDFQKVLGFHNVSADYLIIYLPILSILHPASSFFDGVLIKYQRKARSGRQNWASPTTLEDLKIGRRRVNRWGIVDMFDLQSALQLLLLNCTETRKSSAYFGPEMQHLALSSAEQVEVPVLRSRQRHECQLWPLRPLWPRHSKAPDTRDMSELCAASQPNSLHGRHGDPCRVPKRSHEMQQSLTDKWRNLWRRFRHWRSQDRISIERSYPPTRPDLPKDAITIRWANNRGLPGRKATSRPRCWQLALNYNCLPVAAWWRWLLAKSLQRALWRLQSCHTSKCWGSGKLDHPSSLRESPQSDSKEEAEWVLKPRKSKRSSNMDPAAGCMSPQNVQTKREWWPTCLNTTEWRYRRQGQ